MPLFVLVYRYVDDAGAVAARRPEHRAYLRGLADSGELLLAGPLDAPGPPSGLLVFDVDSSARVEELSNADPFHVQGLVEERSVRPWALSIGEGRLHR